MRRNYKIIRFEKKHAAKAREIAQECYLEECRHVPELTVEAEIPDPVGYDNGLGVVAFLDDKMVGFLCCLKPFDNFFGTSKGTYIPNNAHGAIRKDRKRIYSQLYEAAAAIWVREGVLSHAIGIYSHDDDAIESFFHNGFGMRTIDAIRPLKEIVMMPTDREIVYKELKEEEYVKIHLLRNGIIGHLNRSPMFMPHLRDTEERFLELISKSPRRYFVAEDNEDAIAYIKLTDEGESFVGDNESTINIQGAYMKEEYRGTGIYTNLLAYMIKQLMHEDYTLLGVDFESFNPTARGFWLKYFTPYIYGLTRRIDERISKLYE